LNWYQSTRCVHAPEVTEAINAWLVIVRNIFEPFNYRDSKQWTLEQVEQCPLESDTAAVEFLAMNEYDVDRAWFHLSCKLSMGKDQVSTKKYSDMISKQPVAAIFQEMKEKVLRSGAQKTMLGSYVDTDRESGSAAPTDKVPSASSSKDKDSQGKKDDKSDVLNYFNFSFPYDYAKDKVNGTLSEGVCRGNSSKDSKVRGNKDKSEIKKRWLHVFKESCSLLQRKLESPTDKPAAGIRKASRGKTTAAEIVLEEASNLGPFYDSPGDDFAEHLRVILGELTKQLIASREWSSQLRDMLQPLECFHGPRSRRPLTTVCKLREHLKKSDSLQLMPPEEANLQAVIEEITEMNASTKRLFSHITIGTEGDEEGEIPDLPVILNSIENNTMVASPTQSIDWIPTMEDVSDILKKAELMPVNIPVVTFLSKLWEHSKELIRQTNVFIDRSHACRTRTKARSMENINKGSIDDARALMQRVLDCPLDIGLLPAIENIIDVGEKWQAEVQAIAAQQSNNSKSQRQRDKERDADKSGNASIKRVESLISEGERSVFNFEKELDILKERRAQAKQWLDKLKNSFRPKKHVSRKNADGETVDKDGNPIKMNLSDMKEMVVEGAEFLADESRGSATSREMGKAQSVVDIAEEWLSRVRSALTDGGTNQDMSELQELIGESDDMPVYMEEAVVLRAHFNAMEWAKKARKILYIKPPGYMMGTAEANARAAKRAERAERRERGEAAGNDLQEEDDDTIQAREQEEKAERKRFEEMREFAYPKLSEVQKIYSQIIKIREAVPEHIMNEFSLQPLIEETDVIEMVESADVWTAAMKKLTIQGNLRKGSKLKKCREMYAEAMSFKLNFSNEAKPLRAAIMQAENWIEDHSYLLQRLAIPCDLERTVELEEGDDRYVSVPVVTEINDNAMEVSSPSPIKESATAEEEQVTYNILQRACIAGESILVEFPELDMTRTRLSDVDLWVLRMKEMCSKNGEEIFVAKRIKGSDAADTSTRSTNKGKKSDGKVRRYDMVSLLEAVDNLHVNLNKEKETIRRNIKTSDDFDAKVGSQIQGELNSRAAVICTELHSLSQNHFSKIAVAFNGTFPKEEFEHAIHECGDEEDFDEHDVKLLPELNSFILGLHAASEEVENSAKKDMETDPIYASLEEIGDAIDELQVEAEQIGVRTNSTLTVDLCMGAIEWVDEVRNLLRPTEEIKAPRGSAPIKASNTSNPLKNYEWGSVKPETVIALIQDALIVVTPETRERFVEAFAGGPLEEAPLSFDLAEEMLHSKRQASSPSDISSFQKLVNIMLPLSQRRGRQVKAETVQITDGGEGEDKEEGEKEVEEAPKPRLSRKRKSKEVKIEADSLAPAVPKTKRSRKGAKEEAAKIATEESTALADTQAGGATEKTEVPEVEPEVPEAEFQSKFNQFKKDIQMREKEGGSSADLLPSSFNEIIEFYLRCLGKFLLRVCEADQWRRSVSALMSRALSSNSSSGSKRCVEDVFYLLRYASHYGYQLKERTSLENEVSRFNTWVERVAAMKKREQLMNPDELKAFTRDGERMLFDHEFIRDMKEEQRRTKAWIAKLHATGIEKGLAKTADLQDLLPEVETLCVDLSFYTDSIYATTKCYCLCRQAYFGLMVGCDVCDDWYHAPCVQLSKAQAERTDAFVCTRCTIVQSFQMTAANVGTIANKWMVKEDVQRKRESDSLRITKKIQREEREIDRLQLALQAHVNHITAQQAAAAKTSAAASSAATLAGSMAPLISTSLTGLVAAPIVHAPTPVVAVNGIAAPSAPSLENVLAQADAYQIKRYDSLRLEILETNKRLAEGKKEEEHNNKQTAMEMSRSADMVSWMQKIQKIIWPSTTDEQKAGLPKGSDGTLKENLQPAEYVDGVSKALIAILNQPLLPKKVFDLANQAISLKLEAMDDILAVVEGFRWMSWCSVCIQALRNPPSSMVVRRLVQIAATVGAADERIVRFLRELSSRATGWKSKARKMLYYNTPSNPYLTNKRIDTTRANNMLLEGNQIPITSRIKDTLRAKLKHLARQGADAEAQEGADEAAPEEGKRNRTATKKTEPTLGASVPIPTHITFTGDLPDSSDEDAVKPHTAAHAHAMYAQLCRANKHGDPPVPVPPTVMQYNPTHSHILSDMPKLWPVELSCAAKPLVSWAEQDRLKRKLEEETAAAEAIAAAEAAATIAASAPPTKTSKKARH
jgi:hypothetical protein